MYHHHKESVDQLEPRDKSELEDALTLDETELSLSVLEDNQLERAVPGSEVNLRFLESSYSSDEETAQPRKRLRIHSPQHQPTFNDLPILDENNNSDLSFNFETQSSDLESFSIDDLLRAGEESCSEDQLDSTSSSLCGNVGCDELECESCSPRLEETSMPPAVTRTDDIIDVSTIGSQTRLVSELSVPSTERPSHQVPSHQESDLVEEVSSASDSLDNLSLYSSPPSLPSSQRSDHEVPVSSEDELADSITADHVRRRLASCAQVVPNTFTIEE